MNGKIGGVRDWSEIASKNCDRRPESGKRQWGVAIGGIEGAVGTGVITIGR